MFDSFSAPIATVSGRHFSTSVSVLDFHSNPVFSDLEPLSVPCDFSLEGLESSLSQML